MFYKRLCQARLPVKVSHPGTDRHRGGSCSNPEFGNKLAWVTHQGEVLNRYLVVLALANVLSDATAAPPVTIESEAKNLSKKA
jgi:hypothetical protein